MNQSQHRRDTARLTVAANATDRDDLHDLLDMLGLWPHQDKDAETPAYVPTQFHSRFKQRRDLHRDSDW